MTDEQLDRQLRSIGKECFVQYYADVADRNMTYDIIARRIASDRGVDYSVALSTRVNGIRRIIKAGRGKDALIDCIASDRLPSRIRNRAAELIAQ